MSYNMCRPRYWVEVEVDGARGAPANTSADRLPVSIVSIVILLLVCDMYISLSLYIYDIYIYITLYIYTILHYTCIYIYIYTYTHTHTNI